MKNPAMVALESALIDDPDYMVARGADPAPYDRHHLDLIADMIRVGETRRLDVWQAPSGRVAGVIYRVDENGTVAPGSAEVVPVKATYMIEEA